MSKMKTFRVTGKATLYLSSPLEIEAESIEEAEDFAVDKLRSHGEIYKLSFDIYEKEENWVRCSKNEK
jgi:hypothetical protein